MLSRHERRIYTGNEKIWVGTYENLHNLSHWHIDNEIIFVQKGKAKVYINGESRQLERGQAMFCQSGLWHYINGEKDSLIDIFLFDNLLVEDITSRYVLADPLLQQDYNLSNYFNLIKTELTTKENFYESRTNAIIMYLVSEIFRHERVEKSNKNDGKLTKSESRTISVYNELLNYIEQSYEYLTFKDAAMFMGLSETYFSKLFKDLCGMTFSQYLNIVRVEKAIELLSSEASYSITEVASMCGYSSIRHFNRSFLQITGFSPSALPSDYQLDIKQFKTVTDSFNPTLDESKLII